MTTTPRPWNSETQVNTTDAGDQGDGQIAGLRDGGYVVVWEDRSVNAIVGQRYDSAGNKVGGEVPLTLPQPNANLPTGDRIDPAVTVLPNGDIAVAFVVRDANSNQNVFVRIFDPSLPLISLNLIRQDTIDLGPNNVSLGRPFAEPSITSSADGSYFVSYTTNNGGSSHIVAVRVSATAPSAPFNIDTTESQNSEFATLSNGRLVVVYEETRSSIDHDIFFGVFIASGTLVAPAGDIDVPGGAGSGREEDPDVAALRDGGFVVVWTDPDGPDATDIRASILSNAGTVVTSNILVNTTTAGAQIDARVVPLADGGFLVAWEDEDNLSSSNMRAQRFDAIGDKIGSEFFVTAAYGHSPEAALLSDGRIAFAILDHNLLSRDFDVRTSIWDPRTLERNFDGINQTDFLWQNDSGQAAIWLLNGTSLVSGAAVGPNVGPSWHLQGDGDFNKDGRSDFLWQNDNGQAAVWLMRGTNMIDGRVVGPNPGPTWHVIDSGDFNGDGNDDFLWQNDSGQAAVWLLNGANLTTGAAVGPNPGPSWHVIDSGDFNGDNKSDILWQDNSGQAAIWLMNGTNLIGGAAVGPNPGPSWHVIASGDFNGDGNDDILWQHDSGQAAVWLMNGTSMIGGGTVGPNPGADWDVVGTGEFNNSDTKSDILWQNDNGQAAVWLMNGTSLIGGGVVGGNPGADWDLIA